MKYYVGIDLGGTNTKIGITNEEGDILISDIIKTNSIAGIDNTLERIWNRVIELMEKIKLEKTNIKGIGIGIPGPVINQSVVGFFANFPWEKNINLKEKFENLSGIETKLDNDVNIITQGEAIFGVAKNIKNVVGVIVGTGIGGGIIVNGKLVSGVSGVGGEIGHIKVHLGDNVHNSKLCGCGQYGCWEAYASATGFIREASSRLIASKTNMLYDQIGGDLNKLDAKIIFDCAKKGDYLSIDLVEYEANWLAFGIANLLNILNPEMVVLGGGIMESGEFFIDKIKANISKYAMSLAVDNVKIVKGELGSDAGIKGAVALFF